MKSKKRKIIYSFLTMIIMAACGIFMTRNVQAADLITSCITYDSDSKMEHAGKYYLYVNPDSNKLYISTKAGATGKVLVTAGAGESFGYYVFTDGTYVYYTLTKEGASVTDICRINIRTKAKKQMQSYPSAYGELVAYSKDRVIVGKRDEYFYGYHQKLYSYVPTKKSCEDLKAGPALGLRQYGNYLIYHKDNKKNNKRWLYSYNLKTGKTAVISKTQDIFGVAAIVDGKIYYEEQSQLSSSTYKYTLKTCELNGKNKKTLGSIKSKIFNVIFFKNYAVCGYTDNDTNLHGYHFDYAKKKWKDVKDVSQDYFLKQGMKQRKDTGIYNIYNVI